MPRGATKAAAIRQLKEMLGVERIVAFGDGRNDLSMFALADECYAVENAHPDLKAAATAVIGSNREDGVARWLREHWQP
jgi:hydroxymethylpyrimidine pyrophosphatase-like HAD family hydrolase